MTGRCCCAPHATPHQRNEPISPHSGGQVNQAQNLAAVSSAAPRHCPKTNKAKDRNISDGRFKTGADDRDGAQLAKLNRARYNLISHESTTETFGGSAQTLPVTQSYCTGPRRQENASGFPGEPPKDEIRQLCLRGDPGPESLCGSDNEKQLCRLSSHPATHNAITVFCGQLA